jgi:CRISPR/Cas system-associated exonuclease Cas4 (RecB family)
MTELPYGLGLLILVVGIVYVALVAAGRRGRRRIGVNSGDIIAADDSRLGAQLLRSDRLGLVAWPDQIVRIGNSYVPVEQKPSARVLRPSHMLQVGTQCLLVAEVYGVRPPFGVVVLADRKEVRMPFDRQLERGVLDAMNAMRRTLATGQEPGPWWQLGKCTHCGHRATCWQRDGRSCRHEDFERCAAIPISAISLPSSVVSRPTSNVAVITNAKALRRSPSSTKRPGAPGRSVCLALLSG